LPLRFTKAWVLNGCTWVLIKVIAVSFRFKVGVD
jgi:hypothetical protein